MSGHEDRGVLHELRVKYPEFTEKGLCIDGGSRNMNGSVSFYLGPDVEYIGIDKDDRDELTGDPVGGVTWKGYMHEYPGNEIADLVTCFNTFEHDPYWKESVTRLVELLKPGGLFVFQLICSGKPHGAIYAEKEYYNNMSVSSFNGQLLLLPVKIIRQLSRSKNYWYSCPVNIRGELLDVPENIRCTRDFEYLIGRKNDN